MTNLVSFPCKRSSMRYNNVVSLNQHRKVATLRAFHFGLSDHVASRLQYAGKTYPLGDSELFPQSKSSHANAVYENVLRYLEQVRSDETLQ